ncbi:hypothetical protein CSAL01_02121 [Colletotrichum salicis]|uniref:Proline rich protein 5MeD n=1 Tax=Colletotrichum salicis TaxID=1209931 RepID=A0A135V038_9PEZI|nr:hypothetical protein CSAL01_02121 [Colletotrichum salicis]
MIAVPGTSYVLIADTRDGLIYRFDTKTLQLGVYYDDPILKPGTTTGIVFGVNGIKLSRGYLYFSNTNQQLVARIRASGREDILHGTADIVATQTSIDDLIVNRYNGDVYLAELGGKALGLVPNGSNSTVPETLLGGINSTALLAPTSVIWAKGAEGRTLIVSETGGFEQFVTYNYTGGGRINIIDSLRVTPSSGSRQMDEVTASHINFCGQIFARNDEGSWVSWVLWIGTACMSAPFLMFSPNLHN